MDISCSETGALTPEQKYYVMLVLHALLPIVIFLINVILRLVGTRCCRTSYRGGEMQREDFWNLVINSTGMCLFMVYPNMIEYFLSSVKCFKSLEEAPGDIPVQRLRTLPTIECYKGTHLAVISFVIIPALAVWLVGFPIFVIYKMCKNSRAIGDSVSDQGILNPVEKRAVKKMKWRYGFFFVGLKVQYLDEHDAEQDDNDNFEERYSKYFNYRQLNFLETVKKYWKVISAPVAGKGISVDMGDGSSIRSFFYWEFLVFIEKVILFIIVIFYTEINQGLQANAALFFVTVFFFI